MKPRLIPAILPAAFILILAISSGAVPRAAQQAGKSGQGASASAKDAIPFPQVSRITAEEVERLMKDNGNVVIVDTDDPEAYAAEHIKGAVNIAYDPTVEAREQDQLLSALPGNKMIVFYCNCSHEEDSAPMVMEMWELGYDHDKVKALAGGLTRWEQLHYPLVGTDIDKDTQKGY
ncbi:MAG TPA: rhodanese-like domain-containing protein [Candidatus Acidoferrales bacterium]|nr:rhodanese-like domain-containing protein [Candidatus Acidoferrales bacterium]